MPCGCSGANSSDGAGGPLLSTSLDSRFGTTPAAGNAAALGNDLMGLLSGPGGWIGITFFVVLAGAVLWASARKSE
jgi:hypothetical protein